MSTCETLVIDSVRRLMESSAFTAWFNSEFVNSGDLILINNSFVFRDVKITKADAFLSYRVSDDGGAPEIVISRGVHFKRRLQTDGCELSESPCIGGSGGNDAVSDE